MRPSLGLAAGCLALAAATAAQDEAAVKPLLVRAGRIWISPDRVLGHGTLLLEDGKVADMASRKSAAERSALAGRAGTVLDFPEAVVTAGFVDVDCHVGAAGELAESVESFTPELRAALAYDPYAPGFDELTRRGVTTVLLSPDDRSLAGGIAAFVKPGRPAGPGNPDAYLRMSLTKRALDRERRPTSLIGATDYLRQSYRSLAGLEPQELTPAQKVIAETLGGGRRVGIACENPREILAALDLVESWQLSAFLIHATAAEKCIDRLQAAALPLVLDPLGFDSPRAALRLPGILAQHGIPFAFAGEADRKAGLPRLRTALCLAVRQGVSTKEALASVTTVPAQLAGLSERVGTLFKGRDADLCVWSGAPWDLRSELLAVVRDGEVVHKAATRTR